MSNEVIDVKQLPKETVAKFVNDAAEMETNSFSLKETAKETETQARSLKHQAANTLNNSREAVKTAKQKLEKAEKEQDIARNEAESKFKFSLFDGFPWGILILVGVFYAYIPLIIGLTIFKLSPDVYPEELLTWITLYIFGYLIYFFIFSVFKIAKDKKSHNKELESKISHARTAEEHLSKCKAEYDNLVRANNKQAQTSKEQEQKARELEEHALMLRKHASEIDAALKQHYSLGVIPPDYRDILRVLYIQRAFRNDQVDTMREATLLCDRDIYHIEIKNGLSEIANAIQSLSSTLNEISWNIARMNSELRDIADGQDKLLSETESARYATEAVKKSQEDLVWYERQKWYRDNL